MNGMLYKQAGNSIVVDVLEAIFELLLTGNHGQIEINTNRSGQLELVC